MAQVKKSNTKKIVWAVIAVILVVAIVVGIMLIKSSKSKVDVSLTTISTDTIVQTVSSTGEVSSGLNKDYTAGSIATVKEVFVKVGDQVKKGDKLATFDTSNLDMQVTNLNTTYKDALAAYNTAVENQNNAKEQLVIVNSAIDALNNEIAQLEAEMAASAQETPVSGQSSQYAEGGSGIGDIIGGGSGSIGSGTGSSSSQFQEQIDELINTIKELQESIEGINDRVDELTAQLESLAAGVNEIDPNSVKLTALQIELAGLTAQKELYSIIAQGNTVNAQKQLVNTTKQALDTVSAAQQSLDAGWTADFDGTITACSITAGGQTTALETGITLENMDTRVVTISLGEYDVKKVKVGMQATVKTAYGTYSGEVATIAPTATGGNESSIMDSVGSMAGISGLSSLTAQGAGVECTILVAEPDEDIIIGFNADVEIQTGTYSQVPCVPIESIILEKEGTYVYLYNEEDETVTKTAITTGATSDTAYEVLSGLSAGQKIVTTPQTDYKEETFKVRVVQKNSLIK
ncbi:MAG: biotin/lipoyl-binding protein [Eubacteriales bacterium]|nr:biotin/lipoyl-binding protein [Eubacteriales bacterium]